MSILVFDYKCDACTLYVQDHFVKSEEKHEVPCPECGDNMKILPSKPNLDWDSLAMGDSASPEAIAHFERKHKERAAQESATYREHGDYGKAAGS